MSVASIGSTHDVKAERIIERLQLVPHPEGGWYRELFRSGTRIAARQGERSAITTIYYLLERGRFSRWHVVDADEIWHFYAGAPLELLAYDSRARALRRSVLGAPDTGHEPVGVIEADVWQAARSLGDWSLVGCTVAPGFVFEGFRFVADLPGHRDHFRGGLEPFATLL